MKNVKIPKVARKTATTKPASTAAAKKLAARLLNDYTLPVEIPIIEDKPEEVVDLPTPTTDTVVVDVPIEKPRPEVFFNTRELRFFNNNR